MRTETVDSAPPRNSVWSSLSSLTTERYYDVLVYVVLGQSVYYVIGGLWALLDIHSFMAVTGPKTDIWLVKTVAALLAVIGAALGVAGLSRRLYSETILLAGGSALALLIIDLWYVAKGVISGIYLVDALPELLIVAALAYSWTKKPVRTYAETTGEAGRQTGRTATSSTL